MLDILLRNVNFLHLANSLCHSRKFTTCHLSFQLAQARIPGNRLCLLTDKLHTVVFFWIVAGRNHNAADLALFAAKEKRDCYYISGEDEGDFANLDSLHK